MKETDLRVRRTKLMIKNAFLELLRETDFEKISVCDIADKAMINRGTFYLHYQDKYDLMRAIAEALLDELMQYSAGITKEMLETCRQTGAPFPHVLRLLETAEENPAFFALLSSYITGNAFYQSLGEMLNTRFAEIIPQQSDNPLTVRYGQTVAVSVLRGVTEQWLRDGMQHSKEDIAGYITTIILRDLNLF